MADFQIGYTRASDGAEIAYAMAGGGSRAVVMMPQSLLAPHLDENLDDQPALGVVRLLVEHGLLAVIYDHRGSGLSDRDSYDYSLDGLLDELESVVRAAGLDRFILLGTSTTGPAAIAYTARHPEQVTHLLLRSTYANGADYLAGDRTASYLRLIEDADDWAFVAETFVRIVVRAEGEFAERRVAQVQRGSSLEAYRTLLRAQADHDATPLMASVQAPTLISHPSRWASVPVALARKMATGIPNARLQLVDTDGPNLGPEALDLLVGFLGLDGEDEEFRRDGLQTILFTDLEGSTALTQRLGDEGAQELLRGHNAAVRGALDEHGGREVKHTGDGIMASFPSAVAAVTAALAMQRELAGGEVRVRIGLNAGEPIAEDDDLFGTAVQLAARITDRAEPGQVLVSNVVRELCAGKTFEFTSVGDATLKGFDEPVTLYEVRQG